MNRFIPSFQEQQKCNIIAIADFHKDLANKIGARYEIPNIYYNHKDLLNNKNIDSVVVTVPRPFTSSIVKDCIKAGKNVLTEKPLSINYIQAKLLMELSKKYGVLLYVGYMKRNDSGLIEFKKIINNKLKENKHPLLIKSSCYMGNSYCSPFGSFKSTEKPNSIKLKEEKFPDFLNKDEIIGYENFINTYSHILDSINFIFNKPLNLVGSNISNEGYGISLFDLDNIPLEFSTAKSSINNWFEKIEVIYDDQIFKLFLPPALLKNVPAQIKILSGKDFYQEKLIRPKWSWSFLNQSKDFLNKCIEVNYNLNSLESAVGIIKLSETIFKRRSK